MMVNIIEQNFQKMDFESLVNIISLTQYVTTVLENTGQIIKQGRHTLIVFATEQTLEDALVSSKKLVKKNVYI